MAAAVLAAGTVLPAAAQSRPAFDIPVACQVHVDCWIVNYFDSDRGPDARDYADGHRTYNDHFGTDFAVRDHAAMQAGVAVIAAADGVVRALRDGMDDARGPVDRAAVRGRECGNGILLDHTAGWATQYCHLRKGSVRVAVGQRLKTGDVIGMVGQSGRAAFPHLHFNVLRNGERVDPFDAEADTSGTQLWSAGAQRHLVYRPVSIFAGGFRQTVPESDAVKQGNIANHTLTATASAIVFWTGLFGARAGDRIVQTIEAPDGSTLVQREIVQEKNQIRRFLWLGRKRRAVAWPAGTYTGRTVVIPRGEESAQPFTATFTVTIAPSSP